MPQISQISKIPPPLKPQMGLARRARKQNQRGTITTRAYSLYEFQAEWVEKAAMSQDMSASAFVRRLIEDRMPAEDKLVVGAELQAA